MAYGNYFPSGYQPYYGAMQNAPAQNQQANNGINWVQGINAAKSFPVGAGQSVLLMDSEGLTFYIKSTDQSGMPLPLRIFDFTERKTDGHEPAIGKIPTADYVSRDEFEEFKEEMKKSMKGIRKPSIEIEEGEG